MDNVGVKQIKRNYATNLSINFPKCFTNLVDHKTKQYTNFYLSEKSKVDDYFEYGKSVFKTTNIKTQIIYGNSYLQFVEPDVNLYKLSNRYYEIDNYGDVNFTDKSDDTTTFNIEIFDNNFCRIYYSKNYKKYYLVSDINNKISFVIDKIIPTTGDINPHDFNYMYSEYSNSILFFKKTSTNNYIVVKSGNKLLLKSNIVDFITTPFKLTRDLTLNVSNSNNTTFITYNNDNTVDIENSKFDLYNNILLHKPINNTVINPIILKNQLLQNDVFSCSNNLLSSGPIAEYADNLRNYTSIFEDIKEENTEELELNYVFYNKSYKIKPGSNLFIAPSSIYPYVTLNINDTTFVKSGAFSFLTPEFSDKVYHVNSITNEDGQYLLCTWLSGSPTSPDKVWVDRYYYPDLIEKREALEAYSQDDITYDDAIEKLITLNQNLSTSIKIKKFFDKKSDLVFKPNNHYIYERISTNIFPSLSDNITYCNFNYPSCAYLNTCTNFQLLNPLNYSTLINKKSKFSMGFYFNGNDDNWTVKSERSGIESGVEITKNGQVLTMTYKVFDSSTNTIYEWSVDENIKSLKFNFVFCAINGVTGEGYFYLNNKITKSFNIKPYQYINKKILYGDFFIYENDKQINLLEGSSNISLPYISDEFLNENLAFIKPLIDGKNKIDDIYITLPCGMRNSSDNIQYLQYVCGSSLFKSNKINVIVKNTDLNDVNIQNDIQNDIVSDLYNTVSPNNTIYQIKFENYK